MEGAKDEEEGAALNPTIYQKATSARMSCPHIGDIARLQQPKLSQSVHREECTQCFDNQVRPFVSVARAPG